MSSLKARLASRGIVPKHVRDGSICSSLSDDLREQYGRRSIRVIKGDTVSVLRGEYAGIEGKVEKVDTLHGSLAIEGVQREKVRGGNVKVYIHASNVRVTALDLDDKYRQNTKLRRNQNQRSKRDESRKLHKHGDDDGEKEYQSNKSREDKRGET